MIQTGKSIRTVVMAAMVAAAMMLGFASTASAAPTKAAGPQTLGVTSGFHDYKGQFEYKVDAVVPMNFYVHWSWSSTNTLNQYLKSGNVDDLYAKLGVACALAGPAAPLCTLLILTEKSDMKNNLKAAIAEKGCLAVVIHQVGLTKVDYYRVKCYK